MCAGADAHKGQKRKLSFLQLELETFVSNLWMLETKLSPLQEHHVC